MAGPDRSSWFVDARRLGSVWWGCRRRMNIAQASRHALARFYVGFVTHLGRYGLARRYLFQPVGYWLSLRARRLLMAGSPGVVRLREGFEMRLGRDDPFAVVWLLGQWEPGVTRLIRDLLGPGAGFVDVGAHQGYYTLLASRVVGSSGQVFAFEPEPFNYSRLNENVTLNNANNVTTMPLAVAGHRGRGVLYTAGVQGSGSHSLAPNVDPVLAATVGQVEVGITTLDAFFQERGWPRIDVVKMDVEGAEMAVLSGMRTLMRRNPNLSVVLEFFPRTLKAMGLDPRAAYGELENIFGAISRIDDRKGLVGVDIDALLDEAGPEPRAANLWARVPRVGLDQSAPGAVG